MNVKGVAFGEGKAEVGSTDVDFVAIQDFLANGIRGGAGKGPGVNAVKHQDEVFFSFEVVAALPGAGVVRNFKTYPVAGYVLRQGGRRQSQDGKHHGTECIGRTFVLRHTIGVVGSVVIPSYLQNDTILEADKLQAA